MRLVLYSSERDNRPAEVEVSWAELAESLTAFRRTACACHLDGRPKGKPNKCKEKFGPAWSPVIVEGKRSNENVRAVTVAVFDVDHVSMADLEALLQRVDAEGYAAIVHSTHSHRPAPEVDDCAVRLVMMLSRECTAAEWAKVRAAAVSRLQIPADPKTRDLARLYFLPSAPEGTEVIALHEAGEIRRALSVDKLLEEAEAPAAPPRTAVPLAKPLEVVREIPYPADGPVDFETLRRRLKAVEREESRDIIKRILKGEPLAEEGSRDDTLNRAVSICACALPEETPDEAILEILRPSVLAMPNPDGEPWMDQAAYKLARARERRAENDAKRAQFDEELRGRLRKESAAGEAPPPKTEPAPEVAAAPGPVEVDPAETGTYTEEQLARWAQEQGCETLEDFDHRWIIQRGKAFFIFVGGRYKSPIALEELDLSLPRDLSRAPVDFFTFDKDGNQRRRKTSEIVRDHGTVARQLSASIALQRSFYDAASETFHEAVCPLRPLAAREHPEVQAWLELLGGEQVEKLLDWVAASSRLERQAAAMYLDGPKSVGKTLLASGLARLWHKGAPSELVRVLAGFNDVLTVCPLILADEALPQIKGITSELRRLIGSTSRNLNRKFLPTCSLGGAVRLILAGNNDRLLDNPEELSMNDLEAVAGRFLYVKPNPEAAKYLEGLGGPAYIGPKWIEGDMVAEHALWLRQVRKVDESGRFLVEGEEAAIHERLVTGSGLGGLVCEWIVRYLADTTTEKIPNPHVLIGDGEVWVNTEAMAKEAAWKTRVPSANVPSATRLGRALHNLEVDPSADPPRVKVGEKQHTFHRIKPQLLLAWADRAQVGDLEAIQTRIAKANETIAKAKKVRGIERPALYIVGGTP